MAENHYNSRPFHSDKGDRGLSDMNPGRIGRVPENFGVREKDAFSLPAASAYRKRKIGKKKIIAAAAALAVIALLIGRVSYTFEHISQNGSLSVRQLETEAGFIPYKDADRLNLLIVGYRGASDPEGGLLTDAMVVVSVKKSTGESALISIPRDLWVKMPGKAYYDKINAAFALGYEEGGAKAALQYSEVVAERVTGLAIDGAAAFNIAASKELIDSLGGVAVNLSRPFIESHQWIRGGDMGPSNAFKIWTDTASTSEGVVETQKWVFELPAGMQTLDGSTALYYMRARYSSTDFDRARRQQQVLLALRDKLKSAGVLLNPVMLNRMLGIFERNVITDIPFSQVPQLASLAAKADTSKVRHLVFETGDSGLLAAKINQDGIYILQPKSGNYGAMRQASKDIFGAIDASK
jgi:polyisoprenyl-teichoic acid--peptidoglycan teichoic acid transferase